MIHRAIDIVPWGHNYGSVDIMERLAKDPARVERDFADMKAAGTTVARVHPEMPAFLHGPDKVNSQALDRLVQLLKIAEKSGIHLQITGLACYKIKDRMAWYDAMDDESRWKVQEFFWSTIARTCAKSPAVFCYDLVNEPAAAGKRRTAGIWAGWATSSSASVWHSINPSGRATTSSGSGPSAWSPPSANTIRST